MALSRRELLVLGGSACAATMLGCGSLLPSMLDAGMASALAVGALRAVSGYPVAVGHDAGGYYAISLICTHAGCDMGVDGQVSSAGVLCSCHGSVFDVNGAVMRGPAGTGLDHYAVSIDAGGKLIVHGDQMVSATTRTAA